MSTLNAAARARLAESSTSPEELEELAQDTDPLVRRIAATNEHTPEHVLRDTVSHGDWTDLCGVAANPRAPRELLHELAQHENEFVRAAVADNDRTSPSTLRGLREDESFDVSERAYQNLKRRNVG